MLTLPDERTFHIPLLTLLIMGLALVSMRPARAQSSPPSVVLRAETAPRFDHSRPLHHTPRNGRSPLASPPSAGVPTYQLAAGGLGGGMLMGATGAWLGYTLVDQGSASWFPIGTPIGSFVGVSSGIPLGVHLANGRRGNYLLAFLASTSIGIGGVGVAAGVHQESGGRTGGVFAMLAGTVIAQVGVSIAIERATSR